MWWDVFGSFGMFWDILKRLGHLQTFFDVLGRFGTFLGHFGTFLGSYGRFLDV